MRHQVRGRHLSRTAEHRKALYRNLVGALLEHGRIRTTDAKAREIRRLADRMITLGKRGDLHARRQAVRLIGAGRALDRLFGPLAERFADRPGGYTRLVKGGHRLGDGAPVAYLELVGEGPRVVRAAVGDEREAEKGDQREKGEKREKGGKREKGRAEAGEKPRVSRRASAKSRGSAPEERGDESPRPKAPRRPRRRSASVEAEPIPKSKPES